MSDIPAIITGRNTDLIAACRDLGYITGPTLDPTYGYGRFWTQWQPDDFTAHDLEPDKSPTGTSVDATALPHSDHAFMTVVLDPPYKLNGTPTIERGPDERYGVHAPATIPQRYELIAKMLTEAQRVTVPGGHVLLKCQAQVSSGRMLWQPQYFGRLGVRLGMAHRDEFTLVTSGREQPRGRRQLHARHSAASQLVVFRVRRTRFTLDQTDYDPRDIW